VLLAVGIAMPHKLWAEITGILVLLHLVSPLLLRVTFRFSGRCKPVLVDPAAVPPLVQGLVGRCAPKFASLGFSFLGYFDVGSMATNTRSYLAYFDSWMDLPGANEGRKPASGRENRGVSRASLAPASTIVFCLGAATR
jgi:hypothetical protein